MFRIYDDWNFAKVCNNNKTVLKLYRLYHMLGRVFFFFFQFILVRTKLFLWRSLIDKRYVLYRHLQIASLIRHIFAEYLKTIVVSLE